MFFVCLLVVCLCVCLFVCCVPMSVLLRCKPLYVLPVWPSGGGQVLLFVLFQILGVCCLLISLCVFCLFVCCVPMSVLLHLCVLPVWPSGGLREAGGRVLPPVLIARIILEKLT